MTKYFFLFGALVELAAGVALLAVYANPLGYMGLIASALLMGFVLLSDVVFK